MLGGLGPLMVGMGGEEKDEVTEVTDALNESACGRD
jgi:hypothetical protein